MYYLLVFDRPLVATVSGYDVKSYFYPFVCFPHVFTWVLRIFSSPKHPNKQSTRFNGLFNWIIFSRFIYFMFLSGI